MSLAPQDSQPRLSPLKAMTFGRGFALSLGVVDSMVEAGQSLQAALQQAEALNDQAPLAVAATKAMLAGQLEWAFTREVDWQSQLLISADHQEGKAAFAEKRAPRFGGN